MLTPNLAFRRDNGSSMNLRLRTCPSPVICGSGSTAIVSHLAPFAVEPLPQDCRSVRRLMVATQSNNAAAVSPRRRGSRTRNGIHALAYTLPMLDRFALPLFAAPHRLFARACLRVGLSANGVTMIGAAIGLAALPTLAAQHYGCALALILINRFLDGVDGTMARTGAVGPTDRGAFLDTVCDFLFYAVVPLGFALAEPEANALPAAVLLASFIGSASTFLAFAVAAAKRGMVSPAYPNKGFYYLGGLTEGTETILLFCAMCLWPQHFAWLAYGFATACAVTTMTRLYFGMKSL